MKTKTYAELASATALRRAAAVTAVLLALCLVFMMPAAAEDVAKIGNTPYSSLQAAVDAASDGATIVLLTNIEQADGVLITDKKLTIDLNGKNFNITVGASTNNRNFKIKGTSEVTIKNGVLVAKGELTSGAYGTVRTEDAANVTLTNLKLYSYRGYGLNVKACSGTNVTISDTEIYSQYSGGVEAAGGSIELNNVKIEQTGVYSGAAWCSVAIGVNGGGSVIVNSGTYSAAPISTDSNAAQGTWVAYVMSSGGTLTINGGTFNGNVAETAAAANACGIICADRAAIVNIYGGTFTSNGAILDMRNNVGTLPNPVATLYGGDFSADPRVSGLYSSNLITVAENYAVIDNNDGTYSVGIDPATEAKIGKQFYRNLTDAVAAVESGETITLLKDVELSAGITTSHANGFTLDGNGYSIMPANENNLGYQAVYFFGGADATYTLKNITFKDFVQTNVNGPILRLESVEQFNLIDVTFDNCELDLVGGQISEHSIMRVYDMNFEADNLVIKNCKGAMMMDIGPSSDNYIGKIVIKNSAFINNTALGTALIYPTLTQADNSYLSVSATTFKDNVIGDANADAPAGRGVIHLGSDAYIDGCTFDNNTVYGSHVSNVNYGINEYSGHELEYTNNVFRNSAAYQTNENIGPVSGLAMMGVGTLKVEGNTVEDSNKFYHRTSAEAEYTEQPVRSVGSYSIGYGLTTITSGTYYGALSTYAGDNSIVVYGGTFSSNPSAYIASGYEVVQPGDKYLVQKYVDRSSSSSSSSSTTEPEEPEQPEEPVVEPETPVEEPEAGEVTVETEVTDGGEVEFEAPVEEPEAGEGETPSAEDEAKITGVVLPTGTEGKVEFIPVSEQPAPAGQEENTKKVFEINVPTYEKGKPATIKFTMTVAELTADGKTAADVALWHFDEETGEWTKLVTSYTIVDGVVYFEAITNDFSPFAIVYEDAGEQPEQPTEEPETPASPAPVLGVLAALGAAVVMRRK